MILLQEFIDLIKDYSLVDIMVILIGTFLGAKWLTEEIGKAKQWFENRLKSYHNQENDKEHKVIETEERFSTIEKKLDSDYIRIQKAESHLYEITETVKEINENFEELRSMIVELKLDNLRSRILDFAPSAMDLTHPVSKERYTVIYKIHADFVQLNKNLRKDEDTYELYIFNMITKSFEQRTVQHLFSENFYIPPSTKHSDAIVDPDNKDTK